MTFVVCLSIVLRVRVGFWVGGLGLSLVCGLGLGLVGSGLEWSWGLDGYLDCACVLELIAAVCTSRGWVLIIVLHLIIKTLITERKMVYTREYEYMHHFYLFA